MNLCFDLGHVTDFDVRRKKHCHIIIIIILFLNLSVFLFKLIEVFAARRFILDFYQRTTKTDSF